MKFCTKEMTPIVKQRNVDIKTSNQEDPIILNNRTAKIPTIKYTGMNFLDKSNSLNLTQLLENGKLDICTFNSVTDA